MPEEKERFLSRWARLKHEARDQVASEQAAPAREREAEKPPELPPLDKLTLESDYSGFFHTKVDEDMRRAALKRLFSDPHFNVMDGLDVYVDDYSKPSPLPPEMLAALKQARDILDWAEAQRAEAARNVQAEDTPPPSALADETDASPARGPAMGPGEEAAPARPDAGRNA